MSFHVLLLSRRGSGWRCFTKGFIEDKGSTGAPSLLPGLKDGDPDVLADVDDLGTDT